MYENILCLPYFQGMSRDEITAILDKVTLDFRKYRNEEEIFHRGEKCERFAILTAGQITSIAEAEDKSYSIAEELYAPLAIEPHSLFGYDTKYQHNYISKGESTMLLIDKQYLFSDFSRHNIFCINLLNLISHKAQKLEKTIWEYNPTGIKGRIAHFIATRCSTPNGCKRVNIKMESLAHSLSETRLNISKALNELHDEGYIELHRKEIIVPSLKKLVENFWL